MKYIIDTNVLIYSTQKKQDLDEVIDGKIIIPTLVVEELKKISHTAEKRKHRDSAKLALQIIKHKKWEIIKLKKGHTDDRIKEYAKKHNCKIYTFDKEMKKERKL